MRPSAMHFFTPEIVGSNPKLLLMLPKAWEIFLVAKTVGSKDTGRPRLTRTHSIYGNTLMPHLFFPENDSEKVVLFPLIFRGLHRSAYPVAFEVSLNYDLISFA